MNSICRCKPLLGTYVEISIIASEDQNTLIDMSTNAYVEIEKIQKLMSFHDPASELSYLNSFAYVHSCPVSSETEEVLLQALEISRITGGLFDISVAPELIRQGALPDVGVAIDESASWQDITIADGKVTFEKKMLLDLGGIAKGYAVDKAMSLFDKDTNVVINAGGDIRMSHWHGKSVLIRHSVSDKNEFVEVSMQAAAIATSANYYLDGKSAIISPKTRMPVEDQYSYSVFAPNCMLADALTKVAYLSDQKDALIRSFGAQLVAISRNGFMPIL